MRDLPWAEGEGIFFACVTYCMIAGRRAEDPPAPLWMRGRIGFGRSTGVPIGGHTTPRMTDTMLDGGDPFPPLELDKVGGGKVRLPEDLAGSWGVVLLYRGHW